MASISLVTLSLLTSSLLISITTAIPDSTMTKAAEILSDTGFTSMSLTLPLISQTLELTSLPSATLFSPPDDSFSLLSSGQPSLSLLQFHFSPRFFSFPDLQSLPFGSFIPTLLPRRHLVITSSIFDDDVSLNGVKIASDPVYNDGVLAIFKIDRFLNPNSNLGLSDTSSSAFSPSPVPSRLSCVAPSRSESYSGASAELRSRGYSRMAAFLDLQLQDRTVTVFAPNDIAMEGHFGNSTELESVSLFLRHVAPCEVAYADLFEMEDEKGVIGTFLEGFLINVTRSGDTLMLNGEASMNFPDLYLSEKVLVHGVSRVLGENGDDQNKYKDGDGVERRREGVGEGEDGGGETETATATVAFSPVSDLLYHGEF